MFLAKKQSNGKFFEETGQNIENSKGWRDMEKMYNFLHHFGLIYLATSFSFLDQSTVNFVNIFLIGIRGKLYGQNLDSNLFDGQFWSIFDRTCPKFTKIGGF